MWRTQFPILTEPSLRTYNEQFCGIRLPDKVICANHQSPWRLFADVYFRKHNVFVVKGSRGFSGKTFEDADIAVTLATAQKLDVHVLSGSEEQASQCYDYIRRILERKNDAKIIDGKPLQSMTRFIWGNRIQVLTASQKSVRSKHPQCLIIDEVDEVDLAIVDAAMGMTMSRSDKARVTILSSTHQYADGTMTEILKRAAENGWGMYEWCYRENQQPYGWLLPADVESKRKEITASMWNAEYEGQEPSPDTRAMQPDRVEDMFKRELDGKPAYYSGAVGQLCIFEKPDEDGIYVTAADWARKKDYTVIITLRCDCNPYKVVAYERTQREDWQNMVAKFDERKVMYPGESMHDAHGIGDVIQSMLKTYSWAFDTWQGRERRDLLNNLILAVERGEIVSPFIESLYSDFKYASWDDFFKSGEGNHLPDGCAAMALAIKCIQEHTTPKGWLPSV